MTERSRELKSDIFGRIERVRRPDRTVLRRVACGSRVPGTRLLARTLAANEQRVLAALHRTSNAAAGTPRPLGRDGHGIYLRSWLEGVPLHQAGTLEEEFFARLYRLVENLHAAGIVHNDLAKEANVLVLSDGSPAVLDFQVALRLPAARPRWLFDLLCHEDLRHVLKHKARYRPDLLTDGDRRRLATRSWPLRFWSRNLMRPYQRLVIWLGWEPASGPEGR